jgi:ABC-2 type transport system permease protein
VPVYDRRYRGYTGERGGSRAGFLTVTRYAVAQAFSSRLSLALLVGSLLPTLIFGALIYLSSNVDLLAGLQVDGDGLQIPQLGDSAFFFYLLWQAFFAFLISAFVGPTLVAPDLAHQALPLYLARPITRADYVAGKLAALLAPLSLVTWIPGLLLVGLQASLADGGWSWAHARLAMALVVGAWVWILLVALFAIAISSWIRWRPAATGALFGVFILGEAFGLAINEILDTRWGKLLAIDDLVEAIWSNLFGGVTMLGFEFPDEPLPVAVCWTAVAVFASLALVVIARKVRPVEVSR